MEVSEYKINFEIYQFVKNGRNLHVFRCFWPSKALPNSKNIFPSGGYSLNGRIKATLKGQRNVGGTMIAIAIANIDSIKTAIEKLNTLTSQKLSFN